MATKPEEKVNEREAENYAPDRGEKDRDRSVRDKDPIAETNEAKEEPPKKSISEANDIISSRGRVNSGDSPAGDN